VQKITGIFAVSGFVLSICAIRNPLISPIITSSRMSE